MEVFGRTVGKYEVRGDDDLVIIEPEVLRGRDDVQRFDCAIRELDINARLDRFRAGELELGTIELRGIYIRNVNFPAEYFRVHFEDRLHDFDLYPVCLGIIPHLDVACRR